MADPGGLTRAVGFRHPEEGLSCVAGIGAELWDRLYDLPRPAGLHPFRELVGRVHTAVSTPGDLLGFVEGTENPAGDDATVAVRIGEEDPAYAGGSWIIVQKYVHDLTTWDALPVEEQERVIGRHKLSDIEIPDAEKAANSHVVLNTIVDADGTEHGYPIRDHLSRLLPGGEIIWAPALDGALLVSTRGGDYELHLGQDLSIGYLSHDSEKIELYLQEPLTFFALTAESSVAIR